MSLVSLLDVATTQRPPYFDPDTDLELYDDADEDWNALFVTPYSLPTLTDALRQGTLAQSAVRFADADAKAYLHQLQEPGVDARLHYDEHMNRERLIAFATAGYTAVEDLLQTADSIDIAQDTGVDRDIVARIATNHLDGFSTATSIGDAGPLEALEPSDSFTGWALVETSANRIRWVSPGRFNLTVAPAPDGSTTVACNIPSAERNAWHRKGYSIEAESVASLAPAEALEQAHDWLAAHQLAYDDDLTQLPRIGAATRDYLALDYGITSIEALRTFADTDPDAFDAIFGSQGTQLRAALHN